MNKKISTQTLTTLAMLAAVAYVVLILSKLIPISVAGFLSYDPKDVVITIGGFIFGPFAAALVSIVVSFIEMVTVSETGIIGLIMNVISTCGFACVAAFVYKKKRSLSGAVFGLILGCISMTVLMLLWNYIVTPAWLGYPREAVVAMFPTIFIPFNLIKSGLNAVITLLLYKPVVKGLRRAKLVPPSAEEQQSEVSKKVSIGTIIVAAFIGLTLVLGLLALAGIL